jgi:pilus assembly protein CpaE
MNGRAPELIAVMIAPDRALASQFAESARQTMAFQISAEMKSYPTQQALEVRLRQIQPDVVLLDVATDLNSGCEIIRWIAASPEPALVIGLHWKDDPDAILRSLRAGASEFLNAPFDAAGQREALTRIWRLRRPDVTEPKASGTLVAFTSAKPGAGASTLAAQTAFALRNATGKRVLLADFDLLAGTAAFHLKLPQTSSLVEAMEFALSGDARALTGLVVPCDGVDILPAPAAPWTNEIESDRIHAVLELARGSYDWLVVDLPVVFEPISLMTLSDADAAFVVATPELPSLHLARKAVTTLQQLGFPTERFQLLINRTDKKSIAIPDIEKLFHCRVHSRFPRDVAALHRAVTLARPLEADSDLGRAVETLAGKLSALGEERSRAQREDKTALAAR